MLSWAVCPDTTPGRKHLFRNLTKANSKYDPFNMLTYTRKCRQWKMKSIRSPQPVLTSIYSNPPLCAKWRIPGHLVFHCVLPKDENLVLRPIRRQEHGATPYPKTRTRLRYYSVPRPKAGNAAAL